MHVEGINEHKCIGSAWKFGTSPVSLGLFYLFTVSSLEMCIFFAVWA